VTEATAVRYPPPLPGSGGQAEFLGHPRGLSVLFATEMWERFSYYGMRALLVLYMVKYVLTPDTAGQVIGLAALKHALEALLGPLDAQPFASNIYGLYTGLVYLTPVFGGLIADRVLGHRRTVIIGASLMALGHFMMAFEPLLLLALLLLIVGNGAFKPNTSSQVGELYAPGDPRRDRAYSIYYVGTNIGAFLAPLVCGTLGERVGWHYGFGAAGVGMLIGLATYLAGSSYLPPDPLPIRRARSADPPTLPSPACGGGKSGGGSATQQNERSRQQPTAEPRYSEGSATQQSDRSRQQPTAEPRYSEGSATQQSDRSRQQPTSADRRPLDRDERRAMIALFVLFIPTSLFWAAYEQQGNTIALWADDNTDRTINLWFWTAEIPTTWFQSFNPFMIFAFTPLVVALWARQAARGREPSTVIKMALGCAGCGLAYLIMSGAAFFAGADKVSWLWLLAFFAVVTIAELYLSPIGLSLVSKVAPVRYLSMMMGVWLATSFIGNFAAGYLGSFWSGMTKPSFFLMIAAVPIAAGAVIWAFDRPLRDALSRGA
jgi:proton-dependent oligopeptide transporter, POT family